MEKKISVLMQLRDGFSGYAGITQETQSLFSSFLDSQAIQPYGLFVKRGHYDLKRIARGLPAGQAQIPQISHRNIRDLSDFIISYKASNKVMPSKLGVLLLAVNIYYLSTLTNLGGSIAVDHFDPEGFEDFLWEYFFSRVLQAGEYKKVMSASYRTMSYPMNLMQLLGLFGLRYPKLNTKGYDIFLAQTPFPVRVAKNTQLVIRYHDAIPLFAPHLMEKPKFQQKFHFNALKVNAKNGLFVCVSNTVRDELLNIFPRLVHRAVVIHDLVSDQFNESADDGYLLPDIIFARSTKIEKNTAHPHPTTLTNFSYLLMVSRIEPRKNHIRMIQAWERLRLSKGLNLKLIIVGSVAYDQGVLDAMKPWQDRGELFYLTNVPSPELRSLYKGAACVVCPSLMEGFDLTGIEAMLCGGRVAASNIRVHKEIYGDAAVYFDPYSIEEQVAAIHSIVLPENRGFAAALSKKGPLWAKRYQNEAIIPKWETFFQDITTGKFLRAHDQG